MMKKYLSIQPAVYLFAIIISTTSAFAFQTGKVAGEVKDISDEPLIGVQVYIDGTNRGVLSDVDGRYAINNLEAGTYIVVFQYLGYATVKVENVEVFVDKTTNIDATLKEAVIEGEEIVVVAERPIVEKDRTTTTAYVSSEQLENLPVVSLTEAINNQAGVVDGHFRGGRQGEVAYLVNGVPINNVFNNSASFEVEQNMVSSLRVISGVFNAEYGQALSGVVDITTKGVPDSWSGNFLAYTGTIVSERELEFVSRETEAGSFLSYSDFSTEKVSYTDAATQFGNKDVQLSLGGPILKDKFGIQTSVRYVEDPGYLIGRDLFRPDDQSIGMSNGDPNLWLIQSSGSGEYEELNNNDRYSINSSLVYEVSSKFKIDYNLFYQKGNGRGYDHAFKYNPNGINGYHNLSQNHILGFKYVFGQKSFANLSFGYLNDKGSSYLYSQASDSVLDVRYVPSERSSQQGNNAFNVGGNYLFSSEEITTTKSVVGSFTSQINSVMSVKTGFSGRLHHLDNRSYGITVLNGSPRRTDSRFDNYALDVNPYELAAYAQTKIEFTDLIINAGIRFDYFEPDFVVPRDLTQADSVEIKDLDNPGQRISNRKDAEKSLQLSPRFGIAFPISETGVMRFSAGLFFQTPQLSLLYNNSEFETNPTASPAQYGNASLSAERTLSFEVGLQQGLTKTLGMDLTIYSKDIRNLTGVEFGLSAQGQFISRYINLDYGTVKGGTISLYQRGKGPVSWTLDYTLQFARGSSSNPTDAFNRARAGADPIIKLRRLNWDRRNVLNNTITWNTGVGLTISAINSLQTGTPYTTRRNNRPSFIDNNEDKPIWFNSDARVYYKPVKLKQNIQLFLQVDNIFDASPDYSVFSDTGLATESQDLQNRLRSGGIPGGLNTYEEYYLNESMQGPPRTIKIGLNYRF